MNPDLSLKSIRAVLIRQEETIVFGLIERAQFMRNGIIYKPASFGAEVGADCLVGYLLHETERVHARMRRYTSPDEHPFYRDLPGPLLPAVTNYENPLIEAIESDGIGRVIIQRPQVLGTSSEVLTNLLSFFAATDVWIIAEPDPASFADEPAAAFPSSLLRQRVLYDTDEERERKSAARRKKAEEITRLKLKIARLEAEISQL